MEELLKMIGTIHDCRQQSKVRHKLVDVFCIDGKTMRGNAGKEHKANHIVSAWCDEDGFCLGEEKVNEKSNEITA